MNDYIDPFYERNWLFFRLFRHIVWRDHSGCRISLRTAWAVAGIIYPWPDL